MSASPASNADDLDHTKKITFRFCSECSNLLYPKEDKTNHELLFACRTCQYSTPALTPMVTRKEVSSSAGDTAGLTQDIGQDPTVSDPESESDDSEGENALPGFCTMCGNEIYCGICGQETEGGLVLVVDEDATMIDAPDMYEHIHGAPQTPTSFMEEEMEQSPVPRSPPQDQSTGDPSTTHSTNTKT